MDINGHSILSPGQERKFLGSQVSDDLLYWRECETLVEMPQQSEENPLILEMREREQQMRRQRDEALKHCGDMLRALQLVSQAVWEAGNVRPGPYLATEQLSDFVYKVQAARARPIEVHVDDLKVYDFTGEEEAASWLKRETGSTQHLQALAVKDGSSSISGVSMTPGDRPSDMNQEEAKVVNVRIAPGARVEFPRSD